MNQPRSTSPDRHPLRRWFWRGLGSLIALALLAAVAGVIALRWSLPRLAGQLHLPGLTAPVIVARDAQGVPTVTASDRADLARATGFLHAQDRFFQMDLLRRAAAGELCELLGPGPLEFTRFTRQFRLRDAARAAITATSEPEQQLVRAYTEGVNQGLNALAIRPPEYLLLRQTPRPWAPEDSLLVLHAMALQLSDPLAQKEADTAIARKVLPPAAAAFYLRPDTDSPASLDGVSPPTPRLPSPTEFTLRTQATPRAAAGSSDRDFIPGSNAWAVDGQRTGTGSGMIANDMHLGLGLPNVWYRMQLRWSDAQGNRQDCIGVTIPGSPALCVGSNGRVAWGFTATQADVSDQILLETDPAHPDSCRVGQEWRPFQRFREEVIVAGQSKVVLEILWSPWGPVGTNALGQPVAYRWAMAQPDAANLSSFGFETAQTVHQLLALAPRCGLPWLNVIAADRDGHIGWTLGGLFPKRVGFDGHTPVSWADGAARWDGWMPPGTMPRQVNPPTGALWNANDRALQSPEYLALIGGDYMDNGVRGRQIRDQLLRLTNAAPAHFLAIQLDDRALSMERWQQRLVAALDRLPKEPRFTQAKPLVQNWGGRAAIRSVGYRLVQQFSFEAQRLLIAPVAALCRTANPGFKRLPGHHAGVIEDLLKDRPNHLLPPPFQTYEELLDAAARAALGKIPDTTPIALATWGDLNRVRIQHPFGKAIPMLSRWLDLPERPLPGDNAMPRVQGTDFGASERLVVSPGHEKDGLFHMPGGQSGHFLSPYYTAGHTDWEQGRPSPLLPGQPLHQLTLTP